MKKRMNKCVGFHLLSTEHEKFLDFCLKRGMSGSNTLRVLVRRWMDSDGEVTPEERKQFLRGGRPRRK